MRSDFIFELYTEEVPPSYQEIAIRFMQKELVFLLPRESNRFLFLSGLVVVPEGYIYISRSWQPNKKVGGKRSRGLLKRHVLTCRKGQQNSFLGFASRVGIDQGQIKFKIIRNSEYAVAHRVQGGEKSTSLLGRFLPTLFLKIPFPKTMKWDEQEIRYARPIISYFCLFGAKHISFKGYSEFWDKIPDPAGP